jgi:hypothetical protein
MSSGSGSGSGSGSSSGAGSLANEAKGLFNFNWGTNQGLTGSKI